MLENRTMRGGSYLHRPERLGKEVRDYDDPWFEGASVGFRVATGAAACADGIDNDGDGRIDFDAGLLVDGVADPEGADPQCVDRPWRTTETGARPRGGLGAETGGLLLALLAGRGRPRRGSPRE